MIWNVYVEFKNEILITKLISTVQNTFWGLINFSFDMLRSLSVWETIQYYLTYHAGIVQERSTVQKVCDKKWNFEGKKKRVLYFSYSDTGKLQPERTNIRYIHYMPSSIFSQELELVLPGPGSLCISNLSLVVWNHCIQLREALCLSLPSLPHEQTIPSKLCSCNSDMCFKSLGILLLRLCLCLLVEWESYWLWRTLDWRCEAEVVVTWITAFIMSSRYLIWWFHFSFDYFSFNCRQTRQQASLCQAKTSNFDAGGCIK